MQLPLLRVQLPGERLHCACFHQMHHCSLMPEALCDWDITCRPALSARKLLHLQAQPPGQLTSNCASRDQTATQCLWRGNHLQAGVVCAQLLDLRIEPPGERLHWRIRGGTGVAAGVARMPAPWPRQLRPARLTREDLSASRYKVCGHNLNWCGNWHCRRRRSRVCSVLKVDAVQLKDEINLDECAYKRMPSR